MVLDTLSGAAIGPPSHLQRQAVSQAPGNADAGRSPTAPAQPAPEPPPVFVTHKVSEGETISSVAAAYGLDIEYVLWNNPEVTDPDLLIVGASLLIPTVDGIVYDVRLGDTLLDIAARYDIDVQDIIAFEGNDIESPDVIVENEVLLLPGAVPPPPPPPPPQPEPVPTPVPVIVEQPAPEPTPTPAPPVVLVEASEPLPSSTGYIWPWVGPINSGFGAPRGGGYHTGIDIGGPIGAGVVAAASGQVVLAAYGHPGYGHYIVIRHADGSETLYAHLSAIYVELGQWVDQGATVGAIGCTGWCSGPHLHFEILIGGAPVDPLYYLP